MEATERTKDLKLSSPWAEHASKIKALFARDPQVTVSGDFEGEEKSITVRVANALKAEAIAELLPTSVNFGNVRVEIAVVPANDPAPIKSLLVSAFAGNPALERVTETRDAHGYPAIYAEFAPNVAQFWNDDMGNPQGVSSFLLADVAREVLTGEAMQGTPITTAAAVKI